MSSPWKIEPTLEPVNLNEIMSEQAEVKKCDPGGIFESKKPPVIYEPKETTPRIPPEILEALKDEPDYKQLIDLDSDAKIAQLLQEQFDKEHDVYLKRVENAGNKNSKVQVSYSKYRIVPEGIIDDSDEEEESVPPELRKDWDRFETNEKEGKQINKKKGYSVDEEGVVKTKHDADISGRRNACRVMSFPPEFSTGDAGAFDMKLSNTVFNQLRSHTKQTKKYNKASDRKEDIATAVMGIDEPTRLILYKMINNAVLESIDGVISTGKEAVILHAETDPNNTEMQLPKEVAIKIFSTTLNEFKQRDRYIKDDYR